MIKNVVKRMIAQARAFHFFADRNRLSRVGVTGVVTLLTRLVTLTSGLLILPLIARRLGAERYGIWLLLVSIVNWVGLADFGVANSLIVALTAAYGKEDKIAARKFVANAFFLSQTLTITVIILGLPIVYLLKQNAWLPSSSELLRREVYLAVMVTVFTYALRLSTALPGSVYAALQKGFIYQCWTAVGALFATSGVISAVFYDSSLWSTVSAYLSGWLLADILAMGHLFWILHPELKPRLLDFDRKMMRRLLRSGGQLWIAQISAIVLLQTDLLVIAKLFDASTVAVYGTVQRLFGYVGAAHAAFTLPLWAAYGDALAHREVHWLQRTFRHSLTMTTLIFLPVVLVVLLLMPYFISWFGLSAKPFTWRLLGALALTEVLNGFARCIAMLLNGLGRVRSQAIYGPMAAIVNLVLSFWWGTSLGDAGVTFATAFCLLFFWLGLLGREASAVLKTLSSSPGQR